MQTILLSSFIFKLKIIHPLSCACLLCSQNPDSRQFYTVTAEFKESEDLCFPEGTPVEVIQLGHGGWWAVRKVETNEFGWIPASYLSEITSRTSLPLLETSI